MMFCPFKDCKHFAKDCREVNGVDRSLTDVVIKNARKSELPISLFTDKPDCHEYRDDFVQNEGAYIEPDYHQ